MQLPKISFKAIILGMLSGFATLCGLLFAGNLLGYAQIIIDFMAVVTAYVVSSYVTDRLAKKDVRLNVALTCSLSLILTFYLLYLMDRHNISTEDRSASYELLLGVWMFALIATAVSSTVFGAYLAQKKSIETAYYTTGQIAISAFIGGPLAGCWLMMHNYQLFGERGKARLTMFCGIVFCLTVSALLYFFETPSYFLFSVIILSPIVFYCLANIDQKRGLAGIIAAGTKKQSCWWIGVIGWVSISLTLFSVTCVATMLGKTMLRKYEYNPACHTDANGVKWCNLD